MTEEETRAHQDADLGLTCWEDVKGVILQVEAAAAASQPNASPDLDPDQVANQSWNC